MLLEALVISILILWIYQEYHSNVYLQAYLNNLPLGNSVITMGLIGFFTLLIVTLYMRLSKTTRQLTQVLSLKHGEEAEKSPALADHLTEQRLIEMIGRKDLSDD